MVVGKEIEMPPQHLDFHTERAKAVLQYAQELALHSGSLTVRFQDLLFAFLHEGEGPGIQVLQHVMGNEKFQAFADVVLQEGQTRVVQRQKGEVKLSDEVQW